MKRTLLTALFLFSFPISLFSVQLQRTYFRNYDYINRLVFVFDKKPTFIIENEDLEIKVIIVKSNKNLKVKKFQTKDNIVFKELEYFQKENSLDINIKTYTESTFKYFGFFEKGKYKIVLDVYKIVSPQTIDEHRSFATFYERVGYHKKAASQKSEIAKLENIKITKPIKQDTIIEKKVEEKTKEEVVLSKVLEPDLVKRKELISNEIIVVSIGISLLLTFVILIFKKKKKKIILKSSSMRNQNGFGSDEFQEKMVKLLQGNNWEIPEIARELYLTENIVRKILE